MFASRNNNNKILDLSQPIRLSGLSSGAKLQLVVLSRSPSVVYVALQLPDSESGASNRLTGKFPTTTTLWLLLRHFESLSTDSEPSRNFTARAIPQVENGGSGLGRLFYETPVIQVLGRELSSFTDLQKSLAQLGFNSGSILFRLSFRKTESPLEEALAEMDNYFKSAEAEEVEGTHSASAAKSASAPSALKSSSTSNVQRQSLPEASAPSQISPLPQQPAPPSPSESDQGDERRGRPESSALLSNAVLTPD